MKGRNEGREKLEEGGRERREKRKREWRKLKLKQGKKRKEERKGRIEIKTEGMKEEQERNEGREKLR